MKIRKSLMLAGMLGAGFVAAPSSAQVYVCMACAAGTYSDGTIRTCNTCPAGTYCPAGAGAPRPCEAGNYCPNGKDQVVCPVGSYCPAGAAAPKKCAAGTYSEEGWSRCTNSWNQVFGKTDAGGASGTLAPGQYKVEVSGATGGSGGSYHCWARGVSNYGNSGAKGNKAIEYMYLSNDAGRSYTLTVGGNGGNGTNRDNCSFEPGGNGGNGGASSITIGGHGGRVISANGGSGTKGCNMEACWGQPPGGNAARGEIYIYRLQP